MDIIRLEIPEVKKAYWPWCNDKFTLEGFLSYFYAEKYAGDRPRLETTRILAEARLSAAEFDEIANKLTERRDWLQPFGGGGFVNLPEDNELWQERFYTYVENLKGQKREDFFDRCYQRLAIRITDGQRSFLADSKGESNNVEFCGFEEIPSGGCGMEQGDGSIKLGSVIKSPLSHEIGVICEIRTDAKGHHWSYSIAFPRSYPRRIRTHADADEVNRRTAWVVTRDIAPENDVKLLVESIRREEAQRERQAEAEQERRRKAVEDLRKNPAYKHLEGDSEKVSRNIKAD